MTKRGTHSWRDTLLSRRQLSLYGTLVVVALGVGVVIQTIDLADLRTAVLTANPAWLLGAVLVYSASWPLRGRRYDDILTVMDHRCGAGFLMAAVFLSQTVNLALPARAGDGARACVLKVRRSVPYSTGAASLTVERLFDLVAVGILGFAALGAILASREQSILAALSNRTTAGAAGVAVAAIVVFLLIVLLARSDTGVGRAIAERLRSVTEKRPRVRDLVTGIRQFGGDLRTLAADPRAIGLVGATSLFIWALDCLTAVLVLGAMETGLAPLPLVLVGTLAVSVGNLAKVLPLSQGGVGLYEAGFTGVVLAVSPVAASVALAGAILDHALKNGVTLAGGAVAATWLNISPRAAARE